MAESEKSGLSNPAPESTPQAEAQSAVETAEQKIENTEDRIRELETRLTKSGRSEKAKEQALESLKQELQSQKAALEEAKKVNAKWREWYLKNHASDAEKRAAAAQEAAEKARQKTSETETIWREIAMEEDPKVKKALIALAKEAEKAGEGVTKAQIKALRATFEDDEEEPKEKEAPKVSGPRTTGAPTTTWEQKMAEAKKNKDATALMNLLAEKAKAENSGR